METEGESQNPRKGWKKITWKQKESCEIRVSTEKSLRGYERKCWDTRKAENSPHKRKPCPMMLMVKAKRTPKLEEYCNGFVSLL